MKSHKNGVTTERATVNGVYIVTLYAINELKLINAAEREQAKLYNHYNLVRTESLFSNNITFFCE